jgi:hypothetical protein
MKALACAAISLLLLQSGSALPGGAPTTACPPDYISPHGPPVESNDVSVEITNAANQVVTSYENGAPLNVKVGVNIAADYHGIMVVAMHSDGTYVSNAFEAVDEYLQTKACEPSAPNSMITHTYGMTHGDHT